MHILVVEDDKYLGEALEKVISKEQHQVDLVVDGAEGLHYATSIIYDVIVLDVMLPKMNGFEVVKRLRQQNIATPVLLLTAKSEIADRVKGLDHGADDYLTKPFSTEELLARIRALSRRTGEVVLDELKFGDVTLNLSTYMLSSPTKSVHLSHKEYNLLKLLLTQPSQIVTKEIMIVKVWGYDSDAEDNNVEAYISFLRKKLKYLNTSVVIRTSRRVGYRLEKGVD